MDLSKINFTSKTGISKKLSLILKFQLLNNYIALTVHQLKQLREGFDIDNLDSTDPIDQFRAWHSFIRENNLSNTPSAMSLATTNK